MTVLVRTSFLIAAILLPSSVSAATMHPRVLVVTTFQHGDPRSTHAFGEASRWVQRDALTRVVPIPGIAMPAYCDVRGRECLIVTGMGKTNAATSVTLAATSGAFDLRDATLVLAGIAGGDPDVLGLGSVAVARFVVDGGIAHEIDPREPQASTGFARHELGCEGDDWCGSHAWRAGSEIADLGVPVRAQALDAARTAVLRDTPRVAAYRAHFADAKRGMSKPAAIACDVLGDDTYWVGARSEAFARWWVHQWSGGSGTYCASAMEDSGVATAAAALAAAGRLRAGHLIVLRGISDYDRPYAGESPAHALGSIDRSGALPLALENVYRAGERVVRVLLR